MTANSKHEHFPRCHHIPPISQNIKDLLHPQDRNYNGEAQDKRIIQATMNMSISFADTWATCACMAHAHFRALQENTSRNLDWKLWPSPPLSSTSSNLNSTTEKGRKGAEATLEPGRMLGLSPRKSRPCGDDHVAK